MHYNVRETVCLKLTFFIRYQYFIKTTGELSKLFCFGGNTVFLPKCLSYIVDGNYISIVHCLVSPETHSILQNGASRFVTTKTHDTGSF